MVKTLVVLGMGGLLMVLVGCAMIRAWKSIPAPGGCDRCHTVPISANWTVAYQPAALSDESGKLSFQSEQYTMKSREQQGLSTLDLRKTEERRCFECHKTPNQAHKDKAGYFHH